ncbi:MAG: DNA modification methylase [Candidatus Omnitrophica bacterium]|nr:DNA modification methylase [Candidatus Omnitrophota bacterium]
MEKLKNSIREFQVYSPLIVNRRTMHVVGGNMRLRALRELGYKEILVVWVELTLEKEKLLNIQLNKLAGEWKFDHLSQLLEELSHMPDINIEDTGFELPEISQIFDRYGEGGKEDDFDSEAAADSIGDPVTKPGDIITLNSHRIMCGDASLMENVERLFEHERAFMYWSDWPYSVGYDSSSRPTSSHKKWDKIKNDDLSDEEYVKWMRQILTAAKSVLNDGSPVYVWNGFKQFWSMHQLFKELGFHPATVLTWAKPSFSPSYADYQQATEFLMYGWKLGAAHPWYGSAESSLWEVKRDSSSKLLHPTQKPVELAQRAIKNSSKRGDIIFDSCLGSGSVITAAEGLGRRCFGFEIEPKYCDVIVQRYLSFVGHENADPELVRKYWKEVHNV